MALNNILGAGAKLGDLKKRLIFLLLALIVYRIGTHIPVPGIEPSQLAQLFGGSKGGGILDMFNMFSGGALGRLSVLTLGIMPYISASIIMQLMTVVVPSFEALKKEGESGAKLPNTPAMARWCWLPSSHWVSRSRWSRNKVWCWRRASRLG